MSYVTLTDHDSIDGALYLLNKYPDMKDFFIGEEVETYFPETGQRIHIGVWGLNEEQHREIQRLRPNIRELIPYMKSQRLLFGINHLFQNYRMKNVAGRYIAELLEMFDIFEVVNGAMASFHNKMVQQLVEHVQRAPRQAHLDGRRLGRAHAQARGQGAHRVEGRDGARSSSRTSAPATASPGAARCASASSSPTSTC